MLRIILKSIKALHSDTDPLQVALAVCLGMVMGLTPFWAFHSWLILLLVAVVRVNVALFLVSWGVFTAVGFVADPALDSLGAALLQSRALRFLWEGLYRSSFWRSTGFNNTVLLGGLVLSVVAFVPLLLALRYLILRYRVHVRRYVEKSRIAKALKGMKFYRFYTALR